ncbi:HD domain-containing protein [Desulforhopalus vacuolatus]|uniref:HD domain-containing protein n=1 Tax=Desulforhopalus vacuolatus TaxID=40414 RepID=UPI0019653920|nr:HD domain-containing protein [Desulforhopalus vacuolatus]MBM9520731.1 HD domain-containing protein [Desulforhopalus vacuolatus]
MLNEQIIDDLKKWFAAYVQTFTSENNEVQQNINLKEEHTRRVCCEILHLGQQLGLNASELRLAEITALFHDIGRFEQFARYGTFMDGKSVNHAQFGVKILQEKKVLARLDDSVRDLVLRIITYHNRAVLPTEESATCLFFSRLLRDADKLDIWRVVTEYYQQRDQKANTGLELGLPDTPVFSDAVVQDILAGRIVDIKHLKTLNDFKLLQVGWVYDLNFIPTFQRLKEKGYLDMIRAVLPETEGIDKIFTNITSFVMKECEKKSVSVERPNGHSLVPGLS